MKRTSPTKSKPAKIVFLFDVDNTLLDTDRIVADLRKFLDLEVGPERALCYWKIFDQMRSRLGYVDYLGALQKFRRDYPHDFGLLAVSGFLINYPFTRRLLPKALTVLKHVEQWGQPVLLTDGDVVFQPRKLDRSGLNAAVKGHVLIYVHKENELTDVESRYPAAHYVMVDDKLRLLDAIKKFWGPRVTTIFPEQGHYAHDPKILATCAPADVTIKRIGDLLTFKLEDFLPKVTKSKRRP